MELSLNEYVIIQSATNKLILTNHRVRLGYGKNIKSILLNQVSGIEVKYNHLPLLLLFAFIAGCTSFYGLQLKDVPMSVIGFISTLVFLISYIDSRRHILSISSSSISIIIRTKGMARAEIYEFINKIEEAIKQYD